MVTIVTGFIDLSKYGDKRKDSNIYHNSAKNFTLKLPYNLICFVEKEDSDYVIKIRQVS